MLKFISLAFGRSTQPRYPDLAIDPDVERAIIAAHSHGNVRLQAGRFYTAADVDAEYEKVRGTDFAS